ncbi:MAG: CDP-archaeol synthase [Thermoplasmata archaeon]|nr:CDP-archaeol synthase [Thermoplasmata archaeon]
MVDYAWLVPGAAVLWTLTSSFIANSSATLPGGRGPPMDLGRTWPWDGRRVLGASKTWSGFLFGTFFALPFALLQAYLILAYPQYQSIVPTFGPSVLAAVPLGVLLGMGPMAGDALGSFIKRRLGLGSGARAVLLDQLPFVLVPVGIGLVAFPATFVPVFGNWEGILWLVFFTLAFHVGFNWVGYQLGLKKVPW